ncbi:MAG: helix-turn-helix domain-containing protein [Kiritimatiellaeota bacterium]|nr:helix-turn-helix domain-containing protein [Kiritimatiellota bacterium]
MKLSPQRGWFPVWRQDLAVINEQLGTTAKSASAKAVLLALCQLANDRRSSTVEVRISLIASLAGVSYRTASARLRDLRQLELIGLEHQSSPGRSRPDAPSRYTVRGYAKFAYPSANDSVSHLPTGLNTSAPKGAEEKKGTPDDGAATPPPSSGCQQWRW